MKANYRKTYESARSAQMSPCSKCLIKQNVIRTETYRKLKAQFRNSTLSKTRFLAWDMKFTDDREMSKINVLNLQKNYNFEFRNFFNLQNLQN